MNLDGNLDSSPALGATLRMMKGMVADEAPTRGKEQVGIVLRQAGESIKGNGVDGHKDWSGEVQARIEFDPMSIVVIRHHLLNYSSTFCSSFLYTTDSVTEESLWRHQNNKTRREGR
jgi:hypothetical protein